MWSEDDDDRDAPQAMDLEDDDDVDDAVDCVYCGEAIHEDSPRCPHCGQWQDGGGPAGQRASGWFWPMVVSALVAIILVMWMGLGRW